MESNDSNDTTYGQCRCCLARGHHRDLKKEYFFNGFREVYLELFLDIFKLVLSSNMHLTSLICTNCIQRLRDATSFRMMVVSTEKQLLDAVSTDDKEAIFVSVEEDTLDMEVGVKREVKVESVDSHIEDDTLGYESDFVSDYVSDTHDSDLVPGEAELLARFKKVPPLPTKLTLPDICLEYSRQLQLLRGVKIEAHTITKLVENYEISEAKRTARRHYVTEKLAHIINASTILEHSNVTAFRSKSRQGFPCFYCRNICDNIDKLREHAAQHKKPEIQKVLKTYGPECLVVYVDITNLKCTLCNTNIQNLNELKSHLTNVHKKKMYLEYSDRVIPFKLSDEPMYECQICGFKYETFGAIERHMNVHFRNYVCKECGTGFVTRYRLKVHTKSMHTDGTHPCQICGKIFSTNQKHKNHVNSVHKLIKRFKCTKCPERFGEYFTRQKHMVQVHGVAPLKYKCNVCEKSFDRRYTLSRHMKRDHLEERDYQCEMCSYKCFTKNELRVHMVKHNGERIYECSVCKKSYARKKTLKEHMRIHNNDRRFACAVCGQAFVQKCSLKGHLKTHHLEFNMQ
ncbi:uncharacterized protein LOC142985306 [Anticarsia gemmatalis]|uniref:uncharacterized protein LOC142985306 n=1 Tax=Anticarsia gemmatalis TaxID=129554 RepID=UPI003F768AA0